MALDRQSYAAFEQNLRAWLNRAVEPPPEPTERPSEPILLRMFEERLKRLQDYLDQSESQAEQALAPLDDDMNVLRQWLDKLNATRAKVIECTARPH